MATFFNRRGRPPHPDILTPSEWRVLELVRQGKTNTEIAYDLAISVPGVKYHITNMLGKLQVADRSALAAWEPDGTTDAPAHRRIRALVPGLALKSAAIAGAGVGVAAFAIATTAPWNGNASNESGAVQQTPSGSSTAARDISHLVPRFVDTGFDWRYAITRATATDEYVSFTYYVQGEAEGLRPATWPPGSAAAKGFPTLVFSRDPVQTSIAIPHGSASSITVAFDGAVRDTAAGPVVEDGDWVLTIPLR